MLHCQVYLVIGTKYIAEVTEVPSTLNKLLESPSAVVSTKVALSTLYDFKLREEQLVQTQYMIEEY